MNILRRLPVVAGVICASTAAGAAAGILVAGLMLTTQLGHLHSSFVWELLALGSQTGAAFGALLGAPVILGLLRRVPLDRLALHAFLSATYGGAVGFALSLAFAQPRPTVPLMLAGSCIAFAIATTRLWLQYRGAREAAAIAHAV
ncbi:MAG: hypothetical protein ABI969_13705 [bacterium]